tara:strand:+ start:23648 stop:24235 length:588 start_codon:yes stop_codon:yes gene_type:complete
MKRYTLIGSITSPYVRRLRIAMDGLDFDFKAMMIFDQTQRIEFKKITPVLKIPVLQIHEGDQVRNVYDSRVIYNYLNKKHWQHDLSLEQENILTIIDGVNDSLVILYSMSLSGMKIEEDKRFIMAQRERVIEGFDVLDQHWASESTWDYPSISLYCLIDWAIFRELVQIDRWPNLTQFHQTMSNQPAVKETNPRN